MSIRNPKNQASPWSHCRVFEIPTVYL